MALEVAVFQYPPTAVNEGVGAGSIRASLTQALANYTPALDETNVKQMDCEFVRGLYTVVILYQA
tara:strand:+ start:3406 stop:3600 length:195 start_codon:yes stop_codon:yes gene_type:complete